MDSEEIIRSIRKIPILNQIFTGVYARDEIPKTNFRHHKSYGYIINLDKSTGLGTHWVAIYIPKYSKYIEYFDSQGEYPLHKEILQLVCRKSYFLYNNKKLQSTLSTTCGQWCLFYLCCRVLDISPKKIISFFDPYDYVLNDNVINAVVNNMFDMDNDVYDYDFIQKAITHQLQSRFF